MLAVQGSHGIIPVLNTPSPTAFVAQSLAPTASPTLQPLPHPTARPSRRPVPHPTPSPVPRPTRAPTHFPSGFQSITVLSPEDTVYEYDLQVPIKWVTKGDDAIATCTQVMHRG